MSSSAALRVAFLLAIAGVFLNASAALAVPASKTQTCVAQVKTATYNAGDKNFIAVADTLANYFTTRADSSQLMDYSLAKSRLVQKGVESIRVVTTNTSCGTTSARVAQGINPGGCNYVGCAGDLPAEFDGMSVGSVVTLTACGGAQTNSAAYIKSSNGNWLMTKFSTVRTPTCSAGVTATE